MNSGNAQKKVCILKALGFGSISIAMYALVFAYAGNLTSLFARGGIYCVLPVVTIFIISYFHAGFAGNIWSALGIAPTRAEKAKDRTPANDATRGA